VDTLIPELDRICPGCDAPYLQCTSTTAQKWLGTCPACGWQGWQDLPPYALPAATRRRPPAVPTVTTPPARPDKNRVPLTNRRAESNKNQPLGARLFPSPRLQGYGFCGLGTEPPRPWPRWCRTLAPIFFTAALLTWVALAIAGVPLPGRAGPQTSPRPTRTSYARRPAGGTSKANGPASTTRTGLPAPGAAPTTTSWQAA